MFEKYENSGLSGLENLGNTCFINSSMQIISHIYELKDAWDKPVNKEILSSNQSNDCVLLKEWISLENDMWKQNCMISPRRFIKSIQIISNEKGKDIFTGWAQNDLPEFLVFLIDCFHNAVKREVIMKINGTVKNSKDKVAKVCFEMIENMYKKEYSNIIDLFYGIHVSYINNMDGKNLSLKPEPFFMLDLPTTNTTNDIYKCLELYCSEELLNGDNQWKDDKTGNKYDVKKNIMFWSLPKILVITFKRWDMTGKKRRSVINFPMEDLDLRKYVVGYNSKSYVYDLFGVCNHTGSNLGGHYTSYVKTANKKWYHFNDLNVTEMKEKDVISAKAYCLFYRKKN